MSKPVTNAQVVKALQAAKRRIQKYGWVQKDVGGRDRGYCMVGAVCGERTFFKVMATLGAVVDDEAVYRWNNAPDRTLDDVLQAFDAAIELARGPR